MTAVDKRIAHNADFVAAPSAAQRAALARLARTAPDLATTHDGQLGTTSTLSRQFDYLTGPSRADALDVGLGFVRENMDGLGLAADDLEFELTDRVVSSQTGATRVYLRQVHAGIPVLRAQLQFNVDASGRLLSVNNGFVPQLRRSVPAGEHVLGLPEAVARAAADLGLAPAALSAERGESDPRRPSVLHDLALSSAPITGRLFWLPVRRGSVRLVWSFTLDRPGEAQQIEYAVDAHDGEIWLRRDLVEHDTYQVFAQPLEGPHDGPRSAVLDPAHKLASPFGWHDTDGVIGPEHTTTEGNFAHAYTDVDFDGVPDPGSSPDGGPKMNFDRPLDGSFPAMVINAFYWTNLVHDVQYLYGFDEASGNFQTNNYGRGGAGGDAVRVVLTAVDVPNATFTTWPDGQAPLMLLHGGARHAALDSTVIVHEYGHGITQRLLGGPAQAGCGFGLQTASEGWSDWLALVYTHAAGQTADTPRVVGAFLTGNPGGIRDLPYTLDGELNDWTYQSIRKMNGAHAVGQVWAQAMWEVYWRLVDTHGFDANLYNASGNAGNQRLLRYVTEGLKNAPCAPTFVQLRNAVLQAATLAGGGDVCRMWQAFAGFGLGENALDGGSINSLQVTNGFRVPAACLANQPPSASFTSSCTGLQCTFDASASSDDQGIVSYQWAFGDGSTAAGRVVSKTYAAGGTYNVVLTVRDAAGLTGTTSRTVTVTAPVIHPRTGAWYNAARSGNGISISVTGAGEYVMAWYTYRPDGTPIWYLSDVGPMSGSTWSQPLWEFTWSGSGAVGQAVGQVSLSLSDPEHATFAWTLHGASGSEPFQWLFGGEGRSGAWFPPSESGWGLDVWEQGNQLVALASVYDSVGRPVWLYGDATPGPNLTLNMLYFSGPGLCPGCGGTPSPTSIGVGQLWLAIPAPWSTTGHAATSLNFPGGAWTRPWVEIARLTSGGS